VQVEWEDGLRAKFPYVWLKDNSTRRPSLIHLDLNVRPQTIDYSRHELNLSWYPFTAAKYSSDFLRANTLHDGTEGQHQQEGSSSSWDAAPRKVSSATGGGGEVYSIVRASRLQVDPRQVIGKRIWLDAALEPGTLWPHMRKIPSLCIVSTLDMRESADLSVVNCTLALSLLRERHPDEFEFLRECEFEYGQGHLTSRHPICVVDKHAQIIPNNVVFNNVERSGTVTVQSAERHYECLQKFGRICAELCEFVTLNPGERLILYNSLGGMLGAPAQSNRRLIIHCLQ